MQERDLSITSDSSQRSSTRCAVAAQRATKALAMARKYMDNERKSAIFLLHKTAVATVPGVCCMALHLEEDIVELDKVQGRARKTA